MRRSVALKVMVHCPHFERPVEATMNQAIEKLVDCNDKGLCVQKSEAGTDLYPTTCPVFRQHATGERQ